MKKSITHVDSESGRTFTCTTDQCFLDSVLRCVPVTCYTKNSVYGRVASEAVFVRGCVAALVEDENLIQVEYELRISNDELVVDDDDAEVWHVSYDGKYFSSFQVYHLFSSNYKNCMYGLDNMYVVWYCLTKDTYTESK